MTGGWQQPTRVLYSAAEFASWAAEQEPGTATTLLVDARLTDSAITSLVARALGVHEVIPLDGPGEVDTVVDLADRLRHGPGRLVAAVGGGSLLDQAKLATALAGDRGVLSRLTAPQRSGLILLPRHTSRPLSLLAVPTTLGTGSEVSQVACLRTPQGKRLVAGRSLLPELAVLDPLATSTLPAELVVEGVLEALFRVAGVYAGDLRDRPVEDALALTIAGQLLNLGYRAADDGGDDQVRGAIARLSALTQCDWLQLDREPFALRGWYIANELSTSLGVRKMTAVAALLPSLFRRIAAGDRRLGSAERLERLWRGLRPAAPRPLPADPSAGIAALLEHWGVERRLTAHPADLGAIAQRTVRAWGAGLPALGELTLGDVRAVLGDAVATTPGPEAG
ncbi:MULTISPECIES: daptide-type RiPP biosynthesis dehydogenase [Kitasatospora]|uniref:Alcohol dehydrogenase iron-type/glycerol dehydrogenase GldA domain-containing protein n=1 Tax=Kitasatospora cystarginea TaxID=58350 RepID=A0ABN3E840_9ACTN